MELISKITLPTIQETAFDSSPRVVRNWTGAPVAPQDLWRQRYRASYEILSKLFYDAPELHDLKLLANILPTRQGADERKRSLYKQFADLQGKTLHAVAKQALESKELSEEDKACVKHRYIDFDVRNGGFDTKMARVLCL